MAVIEAVVMTGVARGLGGRVARGIGPPHPAAQPIRFVAKPGTKMAELTS